MKKFKRSVLAFVIVLMIGALVGCGLKPNQENLATIESTEDTLEDFPKFQGSDFEGNKVDETIFKENKVTVLSFWFNGCPGCVNEMPALEKFNKKLKENGSEIIGVNVDVEANNGEKELKEARDILSKQGVTYRNIMISGGKEAAAYLSKIRAFPTTVLVNQNGKIIGTPVTGNLEDEKTQQGVLEMIEKNTSDSKNTVIAEEVIDSNEVQIDDSSEQNKDKKPESPEVTALYDEINKIFEDHKDMWNKIFDNAPKKRAKQVNVEVSYAEYLLETLENSKKYLTDEERELALNDINNIKEIDEKISSLESKK